MVPEEGAAVGAIRGPQLVPEGGRKWCQKWAGNGARAGFVYDFKPLKWSKERLLATAPNVYGGGPEIRWFVLYKVFEAARWEKIGLIPPLRASAMVKGKRQG